MNKTMKQKNAAEEALCSLYRVKHAANGAAPCDVYLAIGALEFLVFQNAAAKKRMEQFAKRLTGVRK